MVSIISLWMPILLSAVFVFIVSSIIHMFLKYHQNDFQKLPSETEVMESLRPYNITPGDYFIPFCTGPKESNNDEVKEKFNKGPVALMTVMENGIPKMGQNLIMWFLYSILVSFFSAYLASRFITPGTEYLTVFRFVGTISFVGYSLALIQNSIWYKRNWGATIKSMFDGLIYGLVTAGTFAWLWPGLI